jgi:hypothetical protein
MAEKKITTETAETTYDVQEPAPKKGLSNVLSRRPVKIAAVAVAGVLALGAAFGVGLSVGHNDGPRDHGNFSQFGGPQDGQHFGGPGKFGHDGDRDHDGFKGPQGPQGQPMPNGPVAPNGVTPPAPVAPTAPATTTAP